MAKLTEEMKQMIAAHLCFITTVRPDGVPNVGPKKSMRVFDDETLLYIESTGRMTLENLQRNPKKVAVAVADQEVKDGYRFVGTPTLHQSGEIYEIAAAASEKAGRPRPKNVVTIAIEEIYSLKPGITAGTRIG